jgi:tetratricopeptide (TPR) repeat protein
MKRAATVILLLSCFVYSSAFAADSLAYYIQHNDWLKSKTASDKQVIKNRISHFGWFQRGEVYYAISKDNKGEKYFITPVQALNEATTSYLKAVALTQKTGKVNTTYISRLERCHNDFLNLGSKSYLNQDYEAANRQYENAIDITEAIGRAHKKIMFDTVSIFYQALALEKTGNTVGARKNYLKLISMKYANPDLYSNLAYLYKLNSEYANAIKTIETGLKYFPDNKSLLVDWVNISIIAGKQHEIAEPLKAKALKNETNAHISFLLASLYDNMNMHSEAELFYKKTIERDSAFTEAKYNLAVMYYNRAMDINKQLNNIDRNSQLFKNTLADRNILLKKAEQYFKKAFSINPKEIEKILKQISKSLT